MKRFFIGLIILAIILWFIPWIGLLCAGIYSFFNEKSYYELILFGVLIDIVHQTISTIGFINVPIYTIASIVLFLLTSSIKKRMSIYA